MPKRCAYDHRHQLWAVAASILGESRSPEMRQGNDHGAVSFSDLSAGPEQRCRRSPVWNVSGGDAPLTIIASPRKSLTPRVYYAEMTPAYPQKPYGAVELAGYLSAADGVSTNVD